MIRDPSTTASIPLPTPDTIGDPNYADSWVDIAGYAKLVADRLEGVER